MYCRRARVTFRQREPGCRVPFGPRPARRSGHGGNGKRGSDYGQKYPHCYYAPTPSLHCYSPTVAGEQIVLFSLIFAVRKLAKVVEQFLVHQFPEEPQPLGDGDRCGLIALAFSSDSRPIELAGIFAFPWSGHREAIGIGGGHRHPALQFRLRVFDDPPRRRVRGTPAF